MNQAPQRSQATGATGRQTEAKARILFIVDKIPYPADAGDRLRMYNLLRRVAERHEVWLAALIDPWDDVDAIRHMQEFCRGVATAPRPHLRPVAHLPGLLEYAARGRPLELKFIKSQKLSCQIRDLTARMHFDVVQIEHSYMALYWEPVTPHPCTKLVLDFHNIESSQFGRLAEIEPRLDRKMRMWLQSQMMRRWEPRYAARFDRCLTVSDIDRRQLLAANPRLRVEVIPNGFDTRAYQPLPIDDHSHALLFVGTMSYGPCADGAMYFCHEILPRIRQTFPDTELWIVGTDPPPKVSQLANHYVHVTGRVVDVLPYYLRSAVAVVPLRAGGGTRLKILEAMALSRPVISTSLGSEGLDAIDERDLLLADDPASFAEKTVRLLGNAALRQQLAANGRSLVTERYDWDVVAAQLLKVYASL